MKVYYLDQWDVGSPSNNMVPLLGPSDGVEFYYNKANAEKAIAEQDQVSDNAIYEVFETEYEPQFKMKDKP